MLLNSTSPTQPGRFPATCSAAESVGDFVRADGAGAVEAVDIDATPTQMAIGVIISKPTTTTCVVQSTGEVSGSFTAGALYYVGVASNAVTPRPASPASGLRTVQIVGQALTTSRLMLGIKIPVRIRP